MAQGDGGGSITPSFSAKPLRRSNRLVFLGIGIFSWIFAVDAIDFCGLKQNLCMDLASSQGCGSISRKIGIARAAYKNHNGIVFQGLQRFLPIVLFHDRIWVFKAAHHARRAANGLELWCRHNTIDRVASMPI